MGINRNQLMAEVIAPALNELKLYSPAALILLVGTAEIESKTGQYIVQVNGPALGIYQMEPATHDDIWKNYLAYKKELSNFVMDAGRMHTYDAYSMVFNLRYATAMARVHYLRVKEPLPKETDANAMAHYHKKYYNTMAGKTKVEESIPVFEKIIREVFA